MDVAAMRGFGPEPGATCAACGGPVRWTPTSWGSRIVDGELCHVSTSRLLCEQFPLHQRETVILNGEPVPDADRRQRHGYGT